MYDLMHGIRVIEVAEHTFAPAAGTVLADWGADVIKVERSTGGGDPARSMRQLQQPGQKRNGFFEVANRGKRSIGLDLSQDAGRDQFYRLIETADVFITSLRADARLKLGLEPADLFERKPNLIYARASAYGTRGPLGRQGGFDFPSSWCRSGSAYNQAQASGERPPRQPGSVGDLTGGATLAGAISAALFRRERTGKGAVVDHSLYAMGAYIMTQALASASLAPPRMPGSEAVPFNATIVMPLNRLYKTLDGRWLSICLLQDRWFFDLARRTGREDLLTDSRFKTEDDKYANAAALIDELDTTFASRTLADWITALTGMEGVWSPIFSPAEVLTDSQALANGIVTPVTCPQSGDVYLAAGTPGQFDEQNIGELWASPDYGQHTDEVFRELGVAEAELDALRERRVIV